MTDELCIPVMMRLIGEGHPIMEAERLAVLIVLPVVLLWAMMGFAVPAVSFAFPPVQQPPKPPHGRACRVPGLCGVVPGPAGATHAITCLLQS